MGRLKKDGKSLNCVIERTVIEQLESYCERVGQTKTTAVERILKQFLDEHLGEERKDDREGL